MAPFDPFSKHSERAPKTRAKKGGRETSAANQTRKPTMQSFFCKSSRQTYVRYVRTEKWKGIFFILFFLLLLPPPSPPLSSSYAEYI